MEKFVLNISLPYKVVNKHLFYLNKENTNFSVFSFFFVVRNPFRREVNNFLDNHSFSMVQKELTDNEGGLSEEKNYDPKYDPISKILIGFGPVLLFGLWVYFTFVNLKIEVSLSLILSLCITILFLWCIMPQNYFLGDGKLVIQAGWPVSFSFGFDSVLDVRPISIGEVVCRTPTFKFFSFFFSSFLVQLCFFLS